MAIDYSGTDDTYLVDDKLVELGVFDGVRWIH